MKKIFSLVLCVILALVLFATSVSAATYTFDSFVDGSGYGTKAQVSENVTNLKGQYDSGMGMYVGPYSKASTSKIEDGILEESYIELNLDNTKNGEFFEVSLALQNATNEYVTEAVVMTQKTAENEMVITAGWAPNFKAVVSSNGIYTYQWRMFVENDTPYVNFSVLSGDTVIGTTGNIDMDTIGGVDDKNPILGEEGVCVKYLWFCSINVAEGINVYAQLPGTEVEFVQDEKAEVVVETTETTTQTLTNSLESNNITVKPGDNVEINVEVKELSEEENADLEVALTEKVNGANLVSTYDITLPVKVNDAVVGELTKLSDKIELKLAIPEGLPEVAEGYNRVYYVVREHNGELEVLNTVVNSDNTVFFETDEFSRYALAYADEKVETPAQDETPEKDDTPKTGVATYVEIATAVVLVAAIGIVVVNRRKK